MLFEGKRSRIENKVDVTATVYVSSFQSHCPLLFKGSAVVPVKFSMLVM